MAKKKEKKYVLLKDIVIPRGTVFKQESGKREFGNDNFEVLVGLSKNTCGFLDYCIDTNFIKELEEYFVELKE